MKEIVNLVFLINTNLQKRYPLYEIAWWARGWKTVKWFLLKNAHAKTEATRKERNRIDWKWKNNKSRLNSLVLTDVLKRSDLNGRDYATGGHHLDQKKQHQIFNQRIVQKKKDKQHPKNERSKYKKEETLEK